MIFPILFWSLLLWTHSHGFLWQQTDGDGPEDESLYVVMAALADRLDDVMISMLTHLSDPWQQEVALEEISAGLLALSNDTGSGCAGCVASTALFLTVAKSGVTFGDLRDWAIDICHNVTADVGWNGDLLCEGAIDNYGHHVVHIMNATEMGATEICLTLNDCQPEDVQDVDKEGKTAKPQRTIRPSGWPAQHRYNISLDDALKVAFFTDIHFDSEYDTGSAFQCNMPMCCRDEWPGTGYAGPWGAFDCNIPVRTIDLFFEFLSTLNPAFILYAGDTPASTPWLETQWGQINQSRLVADKLAEYMPGVAAYTTIGNHEMYPTNLYYTPRQDIQEFNVEFGTMWQTLSGFNEEQLMTMETGGYYSVLAQPGLRILGYNSNFAATSNYYILLDQESNGYAVMRQFMEDTLTAARMNEEKVILLGHHMSGGGGMTREYSEFITDICQRNADLIVLHMFGHSHRDQFQMNTDPVTGEVFDVQMTTGSMASSPRMNPTAKLLYLHPETLDLLDVDTFYLNILDPANNGTDGSIVLSYRATEEYGLTDFTPQSIKELVDRMETDENLIARYRKNYETNTGLEGPCDDQCKNELMCRLRTTSYTNYQQCLQQ